MSYSADLNLDEMTTSSSREYRRFKITEGTHLFRILPPFGTNHNGKASRQIKLHWGFFKADGKPSPIPCSYDSEGYCPICEYTKSLDTQIKKMKEDPNRDADKLKQLETEFNAKKFRKSFLLNAADKQGNVGILEIGKNLHDELVALMREQITKYAKNPTSLTEGVWFQFSRTGKTFRDTEYKVAVHKILLQVDGDTVEKPDRTPVAVNIVESYAKLAYDIHLMYKPVPSSELKRILNGEAVDVVLKKDKQNNEQQATPAQAPASAPAPTAAKPEAPKTVSAPAAPAPIPVPAATTEDQDSWLAELDE